MHRSNEDPVLTSARREALVVLVIWAVVTCYSVTYCALHGYDRAPETLTFVLWFPDWIFWGIIAPWLGCIVVSLWFALAFMRDEDLGGEPPSDEEDLARGEAFVPPHDVPREGGHA